MSGHCDIGENSFLGVNATLKDGITLGKGTLVGMAAAITKDTEEWSVYVGNPAGKLEGKLSPSML
jgi:acetyltransferase-like isoleucine patch superfamily enzyme